MTLLEGRVSDDEQARLDVCVLEPIRTPGSVQPHGALLIVDAATYSLQQVSANVGTLLGFDPVTLLGRDLMDVVGARSFERVTDVLDGSVTAANPALLTIHGRTFDAIVHRHDDTILIDLEPVLAQAESWSIAVLYAAIHDLSRVRAAKALWAATALAVRQITGFDHVMIYHFHDDDHGEIVGEELVEGMEPYFGLHYPSSDIPAQARELYLRKLSRVIADTAAEPAALLSTAPTVAPGVLAAPADLSASELRSVSPHHLEFMRNMGQAATMSFSLVYDDKLIGMITCAHRTPRRVPFVVRQGLEILANQVALQLASIASIAVLSKRMDMSGVRAALIAQLSGGEEMPTALLRGPLTITDFIPADGVMIRMDGAITGQGRTPTPVEMAAITDALASADRSLKFVTDALPLDHPELARLAPTVFGMLMVPIGVDGNFVAWFRDERVRSVEWLGDQSASNRLAPLSPRNSFSSWSHDVTGTATSWDGLEKDAAEFGIDLESELFRRAESRLAQMATHDPLTGLPNRRLLMDRLEHGLAKYMRGRELTLLFIDLDRFKVINDTFGHEVGDAVLVRTAQRLLASARAEDTVCRIGGDEFVIICEDTTIENAQTLAGRVLAAVLAPVESGTDVDVLVTASIGVASADLSFDASDLLRLADNALYRAKSRGGNQQSL